MTYKKNEDLYHILDHTRDLWEEIRGERVFLTGGTGFFGKWLIESFLYANEKLNLKSELLVLTRNSNVFIQANPYLANQNSLEFVKGNMTDFSFPKGKISFIIHAATQPPELNNPKADLDLFTRNVEGTRRVLEFAQSSKASKMIFTSSGAVYGKQPSEMTHVPETYAGAPDPCAVSSAYGESKRVSEFLCSNYSKDSNLIVTIARCFAFTGPYLPLDANFAIGNFIRDCLQGGTIQINGDGTPFRSYLYTADLVIWLLTILMRGKNCQPYNVGSDVDVSIETLAKTVAHEVNPNVKIQIAQKPEPGKPVSRYVPDITLAKTELGLDVWVPLEEAIRRTADFYRSQYK